MSSQDEVPLNDLCISAFHSEHYGKFDEAIKRHQQALDELSKIVDGNTFFDRESQRLARKQITLHSSRLQVLQDVKKSGQSELPLILPTSISLQEELITILPDGNCCLSYEELFLAKWAGNPNIKAPASMVHLLREQVPFFTPTIDLTLPPTIFNVFVSVDQIGPSTKVYSMEARSSEETGNQPLYVLQAVKKHREQFTEARLQRTTEFAMPCVQVVITRVKPQSDPISTSEKGRTMRFNTTSPRPIIEMPDRIERKGWSNRRFTLAGRNFVWMTEGRNEASFGTCWETESVRPKPGSRTGKKLHTLLPGKLCWGTTTDARDMLKKKMGVVYTAGGLDQMFREYLLASQLAKFLVVVYGHTD